MLAATAQAGNRLRQAMNRVEMAKARRGARTGVAARHARTRQLIAHGGLVQKSGLAARAGDDRVLLFGALLDIAQRLGRGDASELAERLTRLGVRAFADEAAAAPAARVEAAKAARSPRSRGASQEEKGGTGDG